MEESQLVFYLYPEYSTGEIHGPGIMFEIVKPDGEVHIDIEDYEGHSNIRVVSLDDLERVVAAAREYCGHKTLADYVLELREAKGFALTSLRHITDRIDDCLRAMGKLEEIDEQTA